MIWFRNLLLGIFTRHLGTKLLALLLSVGLFGFVHASLTGTQEIRQLRLHFSLERELRDRYVLLTEEIRFGGLTITGERTKVDPLARLYKGDSVVNLAIDQKFLNVYGEAQPEGEGILIRVDRDLFADDRLFGREVRVDNLPAGVAVVLDNVATRTARVEVAPDMPAAITDPTHEYEGKLALSFNVKSVTIEGPASAFTDTPLALVSVPEIVDKLSRFQVQGERGEAKLPVEIRWKGILTDRLPQLRISAAELGGEPMSVGQFQQRLVATCPVTKRKVPKSLKDVPVQIRYPTPRAFDLVEDYEVFSPMFVDADLKAGQVQRLEVRLPVSLAGNAAFQENLVVVLDVGAAATDDAAADTMFVPFYLDLKDRSREDDVAGLGLVEIATSSGGSVPPGHPR